MKNHDKTCRPATMVTSDGRLMICTLAVDRRGYEFAQALTKFHEAAAPGLSPEEIIEGVLASTLSTRIFELNWRPSPETEALFDTEFDDDPPPNRMMN